MTINGHVHFVLTLHEIYIASAGNNKIVINQVMYLNEHIISQEICIEYIHCFIDVNEMVFTDSFICKIDKDQLGNKTQ